MEKFSHMLIPPKWGDSLQRVCRQTIFDIPFTFQRPCIQTVVQQIIDLWQCVASGLCNHKPSGVSHDCAIMTICNKWIVHHSLISHLGFPTTKIRPWHQWCCTLIGHHYADLSTWCNTLIRHDKTRKTGRRRQCADRQWTFINKQVSIASEVCGL